MTLKNIAILGVPRSGTSWLAHIFNSHPNVVLRFQPLFSYGHKGALTNVSSEKQILRFFQDIRYSKDPFALMESDAQKSYPTFDKSDSPTHLAFKETRYLNVMENMLEKCDSVKAIGIVRNPLAVLSSWVSAPREYHHDWNLDSEWRDAPSKNQGKEEEYFGYNKWKEFAEACIRLQQNFPQRFRSVKYEDLLESPHKVTSEIFSFCNLEVDPQVKAFIADSRSRHDADPYSVFRSTTSNDRWKTTLPANIIEAIESDLEGSKLRRFL